MFTYLLPITHYSLPIPDFGQEYALANLDQFEGNLTGNVHLGFLFYWIFM